MATNSKGSSIEPFFLFPSLEEKSSSKLGLGFLDNPETPLLPVPPPVEVIPSEVSSNVKNMVEPVNLGEVTLFKGRVRTHEVLAFSNSDLVPGKYEGGLKLWEGSLDLVKALQAEIQSGNLSFEGKKVLELGCGHGLPGVFGSLKGAEVVHFQDFNAEVLQYLTIPNFNANLKRESQSAPEKVTNQGSGTTARFFAGDWSTVHQLLPYKNEKDQEKKISLGQDADSGYDIILMAETVYSISALPNLYQLIKKCLAFRGVVYMAAKKHYFGVGGGTRQFLKLLEKDGVMTYSLITEVADGSSNLREVWKLSFKETGISNLLERNAVA